MRLLDVSQSVSYNELHPPQADYPLLRSKSVPGGAVGLAGRRGLAGPAAPTVCRARAGSDTLARPG